MGAGCGVLLGRVRPHTACADYFAGMVKSLGCGEAGSSCRGGFLIESGRVMDEESRFLLAAIELAHANISHGGRPFGAVVVRNGAVIARGVNEIRRTNDPTAHAELMAIRAASQVLGSPDLSGCEVYASGHPCPMCMAAMRMAGIKAVTYAYSNEDGEPYGLSTAAIYAELAKPFAEQSMMIRHVPLRLEAHPEIYTEWQASQAGRG